MTLTIESRQSWGASASKPGIHELHYPVNDVFLHHEGGPLSPANLTVEQERAKMRELQAECMAKGYTDFPYGISVFGSGRAYEGRDLGFVCGGITAEEAATLDHNMNSVAIVWPGNFNIQNPTTPQVQATVDVIHIAQLAGIVVATPTLRGHRDVYSTACPGQSAYEALPQLRSILEHPAPPPNFDALVKLDQWRNRVKAKPLSYGDQNADVAYLVEKLRERHYLRKGVKGDKYGAVLQEGVYKFKSAYRDRVGNTDGRHFGGNAADVMVSLQSR